MAKHLIRHYGKYLYRHEDYQAICQGDDCASQILSLFEFWTICRLEEIKRVESYNEQSRRGNIPLLQPPGLWLYETITDISEGMLDAYGDSSIRRSLKKLIVWEFIDSRKSKHDFDRTKEYKFNTELIQSALDQWNAQSIENSEAVKRTHEPVEKTLETVKRTHESVEKTHESLNLQDDLYSSNSLNKQSPLTREQAGLIELNSNTEDPNPESIAPLSTKPETSDKQTNSLEGNFSAAAPRVNATRQYTKPPVEPFGRPRPSGKDYFWAWLPEGDWVVNGELDPKFWDWMATSWVNNPDFKTTYPKAKADVINHFTNRPQQLPLKWNEYCIEKLGKESFTPLPDAVRSWQQVQHLLIWEQYNNCKDLEHFYSLRSWNRAYLEYALENLPNFDWSKHLTTVSA
ncbi:hypothetical protein Cl131_gp081 [Aphanizomenon phage vB_AphaS-CL131]|nr:hypothetical protein Cl131_gp081 [Aphanizomenon phage vB_AphaS-CL131]